MPSYDYSCKHCKEDFFTVVSFDIRDKVKCFKCNKKAKRLICAPKYHEKNKKYKFSKSDVKRMYNEIIDDSKMRLNDTKSPYAKYDFDPKHADLYGARKLSDEEVSKKIDASKKMTSEANDILKSTTSK